MAFVMNEAADCIDSVEAEVLKLAKDCDRLQADLGASLGREEALRAEVARLINKWEVNHE